MRARDGGFRSVLRRSSAGLALALGLVGRAVPVGWARAMRCAPKRRGPVIAVVVALLLLASPSLVVAAGSADFPTTTDNGPGALGIKNASGADLVVLNKAAVGQRKLVVKSLKAGARSLAGGIAQAGAFAAIGWVLDQWGVGGGIEDEIAGIRTQLNEIQTTLNKIDAATTQLRTELADSHFSNLVNQAAPIVAHVNTGMKDLRFIAHMSADDPTKKGLTEHLLTFIHNDLLSGKQEELADRISGAHGLVAAAYKVALAHHRLWTLQTSLQVRNVVAHYQAAETGLLTLRVEYMHAHPGAFSGQYIETQITDVEAMLQKQDNELKPLPGAAVIADTHSDFEWLPSGLSYPLTFQQAQTFAADVGSSGLFPVPKYDFGFGFPRFVGFEYFNVGKGWRLPHWPEVQNLIAGWSDPSGSWLDWLHRETGGMTSLARNGVWTSTLAGPHAIAVEASGAPFIDLYFPPAVRSLFLVKTRPHNYW